jgi:hypothetical protein
LIVGVHNFYRWCDIIVDLEDTDTAEEIHPSYYDDSSPRYGMLWEQLSEIKKTTARDTALELKFSTKEGKKLVAVLRIEQKWLDKDEIQEISKELQDTKPEWSHVPRMFVVLKNLNKENLLNNFISLGITDIWFPFSETYLPPLHSTVLSKLLETQKLVLPRVFNLEDGTHCHLIDDDFDDDNFPKQLKEGTWVNYGGFGAVYKVKGSDVFALKRFRRGDTFPETRETMKYFESELKVLKMLDKDRRPDSHFVKLIGSYTAMKEIGLIMSPFAEGGDLAHFLSKIPDMPEKLPLLWSFFGCLSSALNHLQNELQIRHKDIKPQNILVHGNKVLFTDFGMAFYWGDVQHTTTKEEKRKTSLYCAPEAANNEYRHANSDVWSLGCVYLEMMTVLKKETVGGMTEFFDENGTKDRKFWNNQAAIGRWMKKLEGKGCLEETDKPFEWMNNMLVQNYEDRWEAEKLTKNIREFALGSTSGIALIGDCCIQKRP